jgi:hypothetical protein
MEKLKIAFFNVFMALMYSGRRLVGLGHKPSKLAIPGSNPGDRTISWLVAVFVRSVFLI